MVRPEATSIMKIAGSFLSHAARKVVKMSSELQASWLGTPDPSLSIIMSVQGMISLAECRLLFALASRVQEGCIVEVGSYRGRSTVALALGSLQQYRMPVYAVDPHEPTHRPLRQDFGPKDREELMRNLVRCRVSGIVRIVDLESSAAARGWKAGIGLLFIDGNHRYEAVSGDFRAWECFVVTGGLVAFHDAQNPDPGPCMVTADALASGRFHKVSEVDSTVVLRKISGGRKGRGACCRETRSA